MLRRKEDFQNASEAGEMIQLVKSLLCKHADLSSNPEHPSNIRAWLSAPDTQRQETLYLASQPVLPNRGASGSVRECVSKLRTTTSVDPWHTDTDTNMSHSGQVR